LPKYSFSNTAAAPLLLSAGACCTASLLHGPQLLINISCPQGAQQQTRHKLLSLSIDGTDGRTDGRPTVT